MKSSTQLSMGIVCVFIVITGVTLPEIRASSPLDISITNPGFAPQTKQIPVNTTVTWTNLEGVHTATSKDGLWDSGILEVGDSFSYHFNEVGVYPYYDIVHTWPNGMIQVVHSLASMEAYTDKALYASGDNLSVGLSITNPGDGVQVGLYIWFEGPGGTLSWITVVPSVLLPAGFSYSNSEWLTVPLPPLPRGEYSLNTAIVKVPEMDLIHLYSNTWTFGKATQSDWSEGPGEASASLQWEQGFETSSDISWRSISGQLALTGLPRSAPIGSVIAYDSDRPASVDTGDLTGDGRVEVITTDPVYNIYQNLGAIYWWEPPTDRNPWTRHYVSDDFHGAYYSDTADVDSDGDLDVIAAAYYGNATGLGRNGRYAWFENCDGSGFSWEQHLVHPIENWFWGASYIDAGDLDGDGDIDLVGASQLTDGGPEQEGDIVWFENLDGKGLEWGQHDLDTTFHNASEAHAVDLDGDNDLDVIGANAAEIGPSQFAWWENVNSDGSVWTKRLIPVSFQGAGYVSAGDIDNDGDIDLLGGGYNTGSVAFWENIDGTGTQWQVWPVSIMGGGRGAELIDLDGDSDLDAILWSGGRVHWIQNIDGQGYSWIDHNITIEVDSPWAAAGDVDRDGKLEVVTSSEEVCSYPGTQVRLFDICQFNSQGELTGTILDGNTDPGWGVITWDIQVPLDTTYEVEVRASNEEANLGPFIKVPNSGFDLSSLIDPNARFFQYRVSFTSNNHEVSPVLHKLTVEKGDGFMQIMERQLN